MLHPSLVSRVLAASLEGGSDFSEIFVEDTESCELGLLDSKPSTAVAGRLKGAGIRLLYGADVVYVTTNDLTEVGLIQAARSAASARKGAKSQTISPFSVQPVQPEQSSLGSTSVGRAREQKL